MSEEKKASEARPRRGRRRSSKSVETQDAAKKTSTDQSSKVKSLQVSEQKGDGTVEVKTRRRRRVRKSADESKSSGSGSAASTPDREKSPLVPVFTSDVDLLPSPTSPCAESVPSPTIAKQNNKSDQTAQAGIQVTSERVTSNNVIEKKEKMLENNNEVFKLKRVHSAPSEEARIKAIKTKDKNKEQTSKDAVNNAALTTPGMW